MIESPSNPQVRRIRRLRSRKHREAEGEFFVEGIAPVLTALEANADIRLLVVAPTLLSSETASGAAADFEAKGGAVLRLGAAAFASVSDRDNPVGLGAVVRRETLGLADVEVDDGALLVALDEVGSPGNLGTIIRTAGAARAGVILLGTTTDPWHPTAVKAAMGATFATPVARCTDVNELLDWARAREVTVVTTSARAATVYWDATYPGPCLILLGSEGTGLAPDVLARGDLQVRIPMEGRVSSLNVAVAAGILLYEARRPRASTR